MSFRIKKAAVKSVPEPLKVTADRYLQRSGMSVSRLGLLDRAWEKLYGHQKRLWTLEAVQRGVLFVRVSSSTAAYELDHRAPGMIRELNKEFDSAWIKKIEAIPVAGAPRLRFSPPPAARRSRLR